MIQRISKFRIDETKERARESERKRAIYCFHSPEDVLQRMINVLLRGTYVRPHKHENPDKLERFILLEGEAGILEFNENGYIIDYSILTENNVRGIEIYPKTWHMVVALSNEVVLDEIIQGRYNPKTHKTFAPWAPPEENTAEAGKYLAKLEEFLLRNRQI